MASRNLKAAWSRLLKTEVTEAVEKPELYLRLIRECVEQVDRMTKSSTSLKVNHEQCKYLADKLKMAVQSANSFLERTSTWYSPSDSAEGLPRSFEIFKLLLALGKEVEHLIDGCSKDQWIQSAIMLTNVSEHILSLALNLELCKIIFSNRRKFVALPTLEVAELASVKETEAQIVKEKASLDETRLVEDVSAMIQSSTSNSIDLQLATFLRERLKSPRQGPSPDLLGSNECAYFEILDKGLNQMQRLGRGGFGTVHKATWFGADVAKKTLIEPDDKAFMREVSILEGLRHPNVVSLLWYMRDLRKCYIVMELMDGDLFTLIQERLEGCGVDDLPFSISEAMHIILQVAEGILFLHRKRIVHRDLKSHNILVRYLKANGVNLKYLQQVKVADFGLSKRKEKSMTDSIQTPNQGSTRWMAPEVIKLANNNNGIELSKCEERLQYPFKVDVFSFGMLCYEVLSGKLPFWETKVSEVKKKILAGERPHLPYQCPERLRTLIQNCWSHDPSKRPSFHDICSEMRHLKCAHFMTSTWAGAPRCFSLDEIWRMTNKFSKDNLLSWKALTMVYKGVTFDTGEAVAVKRMFEKCFQCLDEFKTQMELLAGLHHNNLVRLVGFCNAEEEAILVFEYMPNNTLDKWFSEDVRHMTWPVRRTICLGVANGIYYMHSLAQPRIIHRNITLCNILLDQNLEPKIAGFQSALFTSDNISEFRWQQQGATSLGYLAPEYGTVGQASEKVDVYSFGVVLLEIVSGRRNFDLKFPEGQRNLGEWAWKLHSEGRIKELIDPALDLQAIEETAAVRTVLIALLCMHTAVETRPEMTLVVAMLQGNKDEEILRLGLEHDKERFGMCNDELPDSFGSTSGEFRPSSHWRLDHFGDAKGQLAAERSAEGVGSSDANFHGQNLVGKAQIGLGYLSSTSPPKVREGLTHLIKCAARPGGPPAPARPIVVKAIPLVMKLAEDTQYSKLALKLMVELTSDKGVGPDNEIILEVAGALDVLISLMKEGSLTVVSLLAAETVGNILVKKQVRKELYRYDGILPALVAFLNVDATSQSIKHLNRANDVGLKVLQRLAKCSESERSGDKARTIVAALIKLLCRGLNQQRELEHLVKDSLVALDNQLLTMDYATSTNEVCMVVRKDISELTKPERNFISHTSLPGRMAIMNIMTKLCGFYKEGVDKDMILWLLSMMKSTRSEIVNFLEPLPPDGLVAEKLRSLAELFIRSVKLLRFFAAHGKNTAQSALSDNVEELEEFLVHGEIPGICDESRLDILSIPDQIDTQGTPAMVVEILVKMLKSKNLNCRQGVARKLRMLVEGNYHVTEFKEAGGIVALVVLLEDADLSCRRDALVALRALPPRMAIPVGLLPAEAILEFLSQLGHTDVTNAAGGFFNLMVKEKAVSADTFLRTGASEAVLKLLDENPKSRGSHDSASALLEMAKEDQRIRLRIAEPGVRGLRGLDILVKYARDHGGNKFKESLADSLVLFCRDGETCQEAVIDADGHGFFLESLRENIAKEESAEGLLELIRNTSTTEKILKGGFVETALRSIDESFACTDIALVLSRLSSIREGLNQIYESHSLSVSALLTLIEHCPDRSGKDAAALIISRLYPCLCAVCCKVDLTQRSKIAEECPLFLKYLDPSDPHHSKGFLRALVVIAAVKKGKELIFESEGHRILVEYLSVTETEIQGLVLKILSEMSASEGDHWSKDAWRVWRIRRALMDIRVDEKLLNLVKSDEFSRKAESMKDALILIGNLSLAGSYACKRLLEGGALNWLLEVLERDENSLSMHTSLAMEALGKFLNDPAGILAFVEGGGVKSVVAILKGVYSERSLGVYRGPGLTRSSISILTAVAKESPYRVCHAMIECELHRVLNAILKLGPLSSTIRDRARSLMELLIDSDFGPTSRISDDLSEWDCLQSRALVRSRSSRMLQSNFVDPEQNTLRANQSDDEGESS